MKAAYMAVALAMGLLGATTVAKANDPMKKPTNPGYGQAPSPEVNTLVGFLVVAGTVAFIKRRRGDKAEVENAAV